MVDWFLRANGRGIVMADGVRAAASEAVSRAEALKSIAEARVKTGDLIARLMMTYVGFAAISVFALLSPDVLMIHGQSSVALPIAGNVSFVAFMLVAPLALIGMRIYLEIYVRKWRELEAQLTPEVQPLTVSPLKHPLLRYFSLAVLYLLLSAMLGLFAWKAAVWDYWGSAFLGLTVVAALTQVSMVVGGVAGYRVGMFLSSAVLGLSLFAADALPRRAFDLFRAEMANVYLSQQDLRGANLVGAKIQGAVFVYVNLEGAKMNVANLQGASLYQNNLQGAGLSAAKIQEADLSESNLQGAELTFANLQGAKLWHVNLQRARLRYARLQRAELIGAKLQGANLRGVRFQGADLSYAKLQGADLEEANLQGAEVTDANFENATGLGKGSLLGACYDSVRIESGNRLAGPPYNLPSGVDPPTKICPEEDEK